MSDTYVPVDTPEVQVVRWDPTEGDMITKMVNMLFANCQEFFLHCDHDQLVTLFIQYEDCELKVLPGYYVVMHSGMIPEVMSVAALTATYKMKALG